MKRSSDLTAGPLFRQILVYTIPIILTTLLQLLFNAADLVVVGNYCGSTSVAAVGATTSLTSLMVNFFMGVSVGAGVTVAHAIGSGNREEIFKTVHTCIPTSLICGAIITAVGVTCAGSFLRWMGTPEDVVGLSSVYMRIYFCGSLGNMVYNFGAAVLRADGDTQTPLIYLTVAGVLNVILNLFFVLVFHMDVAGVALATIISQYISAFLVLRCLVRRKSSVRLHLAKLRLYPAPLRKILTIGIPAGFQSSMFAISNVIIQSAINSFGSVCVAGSAAAGNIEGFVYSTINSVATTNMNFVGQNVGAEKYDRVKRSMLLCILLASVNGLFFGQLVNVFAKPLLGIYIKDSPEAIEYGIYRLMGICGPYFLCGCMDCASATLRGLGHSLEPMIICIVGVCVLRILLIYTVFQLPRFHTLFYLFLSYPISWTLTCGAELIVCRKYFRRFDKQSISS